MAGGISIEVISIFLALIGLGGAGALFVLPHPYADYVGWLLIGVAVVGALLAIYHFAWTSRAMTIATAIALTVAMLALNYWYYSNYSLNGGLWHISLGLSPTPQPKQPDQTSASTSPTQPPPLPTIPIQSRLDRFIFACDVPIPLTAEQDAKQKEVLQNNIQGWADTIGLSASFTGIKNGTQVTIEAKTKDAKERLLSMGILSGITKVLLEARWIDRRQIVVARADVPTTYQMFSGLVPDPHAQQIIEGENLIARFLGATEGACHLI